MISTRSFFRCLALVLLLTLSAGSAAPRAVAADAPRTESWDSVVSLDWLKRIRLPAGTISNALFDWTDDVSFFNGEVWEDGSQVDLRTQRRVFDNQDILNSWTVIDRLQIQARFPIFSTEVFGGPIGFSIGVGTGVNVFNIRQTNPLDYGKLESVRQREAEIQAALASSPSKPEGAKGPIWDIPVDDPQDQARFGKFWNRLLFPLRLPLTAASVSKLSNGEVIAYNASGSVYMGSSVGWNYDNSVLNASAGVSISTYVRGEYRISILKESDRFVRLKVTRLGAAGTSENAGGNINPTLLDGYVIIKRLNKFIKVTPFSLNATQELSHSFDVGYRYDLAKPQAREAYEQAVLGQLAFSDELAFDGQGNATNAAISGVEKIFSREAKGKRNEISQSFRLGILFKLDHRTSQQTVDAIITFPDGTYRIFQSFVENSVEWRIFWAWYEKLYYKFLVHFDNQKQLNGEFPLSLWAEGNIQDSSTSRKELMAYILETENTVGKFGIFPRPPLMAGNVSSSSPDGQPTKLNRERSSFFYRIAFSQAQVNQLVNTPASKAWELLESAFQVTPGSWSNPWTRFWKRFGGELLNILTYPLYIADVPVRLGNIQGHAKRIHDRWMDVKQATDAKTMAERLGLMFYDRRYSFELMRLLRASMNDQPVAYEVSAYSPVFGRVAETGNSQIFIDDVATRAQREVDFDRETGRIPTQDREAAITDLRSEALSGSRASLQLYLKSAPKAIYVELYERGFWSWKKTANVLVYTNGELLAGPNVIILDPAETGSTWFGIAKALKPNTKHRVRLAVNVSGLSWGPAQKTEFTTLAR
jgi:hypothetical protein